MNTVECSRQDELLETVRGGRWPDGCEDTLREHVRSCIDCSELVDVASALLFDHQLATREAVVPPSGVIWWRAQRRSRQDAVRTATRVATVVQTVFVLCGAFVLIAVLSAVGLNAATVGHVRELLSFDLPTLAARWSTPLLVALGASLFIGPLALYFAFARD